MKNSQRIFVDASMIKNEITFVCLLLRNSFVIMNSGQIGMSLLPRTLALWLCQCPPVRPITNISIYSKDYGHDNK